MTGLTQSALQPSAERFVIFFCVSIFALYERKNPGALWAYRYNGKYRAAAGEKADAFIPNSVGTHFVRKEEHNSQSAEERTRLCVSLSPTG
jgi:hypothetical protein